MRNVIAIILIFLNSAACLPTIPPSMPERPLNIGELILRDDFEQVSTWDLYQLQGFSLQIVNGGYRGILNMPGRYAWGLNYQNHDNIVMEADVLFLSDFEGAIAGLMCRANPKNDGTGYFFVLSANGAFSIRRGTEASVDPLVEWQSHPAVPQTRASRRIRVACVDNYLGMWVDGVYLDGVEDDSYHSGYAGLAMGSPTWTNENTEIGVIFDNLRIWSAEQR